ncbi:hypothetical protein AbraIFM66951_010533 [Aspergillus brasiliensis]|nr:hypothetical protein AbraIFM66951_010533 [Aspergillus brasiliensis]
MAPSEDAPNTTPSEYTPRAVMTLIGSFCGMFCTVGFVNSFGLFLEYYKKDQLSNQPESTIAWIAAIDIFFIFGVSVVSGPLLDTVGPRILLCIGSLGTIFSIMMTSLCKELYQFILAQGILLGISLSLLTCPMIALVGQHIKIKRGAAVGIVIGGSSLGGVLWPIIVNELLQKPTIGFGWTMRIVGFIMLPLLGAKPEPEPEPSSKESTDKSLLKNRSLHLTCLSFFIIYFGMFSPFFYISSYGVTQGIASSSLSFYTISMLNGASLFGRIIPGILADKYGRFNTCIVFTILSGIVALCWTKADTVAGLVVFAVAYGFSSGLRADGVVGIGYSLPPTGMCFAACYSKDGGVSRGCGYGSYGFECYGWDTYFWGVGAKVWVSGAVDIFWGEFAGWWTFIVFGEGAAELGG